MAKGRRAFTPGSKAEAVRRIAEQGKSLAKVARELAADRHCEQVREDHDREILAGRSAAGPGAPAAPPRESPDDEEGAEGEEGDADPPPKPLAVECDDSEEW